MFKMLRIKSLSPHADFSQHLSERHFLIMVGCAIIVHTLVLVAFQLMPREEILQIPVRSLNIKFGGSGEGSMAQTPNIGLPLAVQGVPNAMSAQPEISEMKVEPSAATKTLENVIAEAPSEIDIPQSLPKPKVEKAKTAIQQTPSVQKLATQTLPNLTQPQVISEQTMRAVEQLPSEYVRGGEQGGQKSGDNFGVENGTVGGVGIGNAGSQTASAEVLRRYEQIISLWIQRNKVYPASAKSRGLQGQAVVRIRINRGGSIVYSRIDKPTAHPELNDAIAQMIRASNPVPAVPSNYPAGNLFEFLIPVSFRLE